ncbi:MAG: SDR family oxidoreductase [Pseudomonadota bacterium]
MIKTHPDFSLAGRRALVTGAGRGLGREIAKALAAAGARVWLNGRQVEPLQDAVAEIRAQGFSAEAAPFDVTDSTAAEQWFASQPDGIDILVNNATLRDRRPTAELTPEAVQTLIDVNAMAAYRLTRLATSGMVARGRGAVLNITSIAGPLAGGSDAGYTLAKGGLAALTRSHAVEFAPHGIRVNAIAPGFFATEANAAWTEDPDVTTYLKSRSPMGRWAAPNEIGGAAVFLCSDAASFVTGHTLVVDGGMSVKM